MSTSATLMILPPNSNLQQPVESDATPDQMGQLGIDKNTSSLLLDALMYNNRLDRLTHGVFRHHPNYMEPFLRTHNFILRGDGPLPYSYRHYIAIMAAARHQCTYLVNLQKQDFALCGDKRWLAGLEHIPQKLRDLNEINKILAHQPWLLNKCHIEKLTKGRDDSWSVSEVVHAIVLLAHFHALSSLVFSSGINDEESLPVEGLASATQPQLVGKRVVSGNDSPPSPPSPPSGLAGGEGSVEVLMQKMHAISEQKLSDETSLEDLGKAFERVESQTAEIGLASLTPLKCEQEEPDLLQYVDDSGFAYVDFARRRESGGLPTFRVQDYSWDDHGFSLVNQLYDNVGNLLDEKFRMTYNLTYNTMGRKTNVDTSMFRRAIWNYIQCMYGIRHDDYDYREVNELLDRDLKAYIKGCCCFPQRTGKKDCDNVMREFRRSEKIHVNLMIAEARMQAELLYALRAVMKYMT